MKSIFTLIFGVILGLAGATLALRLEPSRSLAAPLLDRVLPLATPPALSLADLPAGADRFSAGQLAGLGVRTCFARDPAYADAPPPWMVRPPLGPMNAAETAARPAPDLAALPGLLKLEQVRSPNGNAREHCAASRIAEHWFMTAAHCLKEGSFDTLLIAPKPDIAEESAVIMPVERALCNAAWYSGTGKFDDDIALLYVADTTALADLPVTPIERPADGFTVPDFSAPRFAGWGKNGDNRFLQGGPVMFDTFGTLFLTVSPVGDFGPCVGDSGGPLFAATPKGTRIVGVLSSVTDDACPPYGQAFYVRTRAFADWLDRAMATCRQKGRFVC